MLPTFQPRPPFHRRTRAAEPAPPSPPAPPVTFGVLKVVLSPGEPPSATWLFDSDIAAPVAPLTGLAIDGHAGGAWGWDDTNAIRVEYGVVLAIGQAWSNTAGAGGIVGLGGETLAAGSGVVLGS